MNKVVATLPVGSVHPYFAADGPVSKGFIVIGHAVASGQLTITPPRHGGIPLEEYFTDEYVATLRAAGVIVEIS